MSLSSSSPSMLQINKSSTSQSVSDKSGPNTVGKCSNHTTFVIFALLPLFFVSCLISFKVFVNLSGYQHVHEIILCVLFPGGRYKSTQETMREVIPLMGVWTLLFSMPVTGSQVGGCCLKNFPYPQSRPDWSKLRQRINTFSNSLRLEIKWWK